MLVPSSAGEGMNAALSTIYCILSILLRYFQVFPSVFDFVFVFVYMYLCLYVSTIYTTSSSDYFQLDIKIKFITLYFIFVPSLILRTIIGRLSTLSLNKSPIKLTPMISALHLLLDVCWGSLPFPTGRLSKTFNHYNDWSKVDFLKSFHSYNHL